MSFLYPAFLFGLSAISIPVIIHLFNLQRPKKVYFSNVRFLRDVQQTTTNKLKLKHWLILLSRILFITALVFAFAQPFLAGNKSADLRGDTEVVTYMDNSYSMQNEIEGQKALDEAIKSLNGLTEVYPPSAKYILYTNDLEGRDQFGRTRDKLKERITELNYSGVYREAGPLTRRMQQHAGSVKRHYFFFSDFQKSTLGSLNEVKWDTTARYFLVPLRNEEVSNLYIDSIWLGSPLVRAGENNTLEVQMVNDGKEVVKDRVLKLFIENVQVSTATLNAAAGTKVKVAFRFNLNGTGQQRAVIKWDDHPVDFDNAYHFILNVSPPIKVTHLFEGDGKYVKAVYTSDPIFDLYSADAGSIDYSRLASSRIIVLDGLRSIPSSLVSSLNEFVQKGGSLMFYPGQQPDVDSYNQLMLMLGLPQLKSVKTDTVGNRLTYELLPPDPRQPFFGQVFEKTEGKILMPYAYPTISWPRGGETLLMLKTNDPWMSIFNSGKGKVYLASSPLEPAYTSLPRHAIFVPLMYKAAFNSVRESEQLAWTFQQPLITLEMDEEVGTGSFTLVHDNDAAFTPVQHIAGGELHLELPKEDLKSGFYSLRLDGKHVHWIALNYGKAESQMRFATQEELKKAVEGRSYITLYEPGDSEVFTQAFKNEHVGVSLWKYCVILALLFLLTEILLIRFL